MSPGGSEVDGDDGVWRGCAQLSRLDKLSEEARTGRQRAQLITEQILAAYQQAQAAWQQAQATWNRILACTEEQLTPTVGRGTLQRSAYARLVARLETMPVIEQAKGIIMAESACSEDQAFDLLRRASQRMNVPVRDLAARIVAAESHRDRAANKTPSPTPRALPKSEPD